MKLCYIAGPYRADNPIEVEQNILNAKKAALKVIDLGYFPVIPHANTARFEHYTDKPDEFWLEGTMELLERCDAIFLMEGWEDSKGAVAEFRRAKDLGLTSHI